MTADITHNEDLKQVEAFWNANLCGKQFVDVKFPSKEFFERYRAFRYKKTHHLDKYIDWRAAKGRDVLEIGLGIGADATRWAQHAKSYTGVDLTVEAVAATKMHFDHLARQGRIMQGNAEQLQLPDNAFDIVYSHGVLHHTASIENTFREIYRVLRPGGQFIVMLYAKGSFNYWIRIQLYFRLRLRFELLRNKLGGRPKGIWENHVSNYRKEGSGYLSWSNFPHRCTDGPDCKIANIYWLSEMTGMLKKAGFEIEQCKKAHFPLGGRLPAIERWLASMIGFHQLIWARKK